MFELQSGLCKICTRPLPAHDKPGNYICVDHCHKTGKVRGLLCDPCNVGIGKFEESSTALRRAADYIESQGGL